MLASLRRCPPRRCWPMPVMGTTPVPGWPGDPGLPYLVGVASTTRFRLAQDVEEDSGEQPAPPYQGQGRPTTGRVWRTGYQVERPTLSWKSCSKMLAGYYLAGRDQGQSGQGVHSSAGLPGWS